MPHEKGSRKQQILEAGVEDMRLENGNAHMERAGSKTDEIKAEPGISNTSSPGAVKMDSASQSPTELEEASQSPSLNVGKHEEIVGGDVTVKLEPGKPPKLARSTSQKIVAGPAQLFKDEPSRTEEARGHFQTIAGCIYSNKYIGSTEHGSMDCDCAEEWGKSLPFSSLQFTRRDTELSIKMALPRQMLRAGTIRIVSIVRRKWSAWATAGAEQTARIKDFSNDNTHLLL